MSGEPSVARVELWVDPSCPWAWQTSTWLRGLRDGGDVEITWRLFNLEVNAVSPGGEDPGVGFLEASPRYGVAHLALALVRDEGGGHAFEALYVAIGRRLHERRREMSTEVLREAAAEAGMGDAAERAVSAGWLPGRLLEEHREARARDVFGVPTLTVDGSPPIYGPILPVAPEGTEALEWWAHVRWLAARPDFFELKRWPRASRPGQRPSPS